jgi:hypothetical protein
MKAFLFILTLCISTTAFAQFNKSNRPPKGSNSAAGLPLKERVYFGGGGGFNTGTNTNGLKYTYISVSPLIGYRVTLPWSVGLQVIYQNVNYPQLGARYNQYGFAPFTQYRFGQIFAYGEYQMISAPIVNTDQRSWYSRLPLGLGFTQPIGPRAAINVMAAYDVLWPSQQRTSPFLTPWVFRIYVTAGGVSF